MFAVSEHYRNAINNSNPSYITGEIIFIDGSTRELTMADIVKPSITMQAVTQDVLEFGAAVLGQLDISIKIDKNESRYKYYNGIIRLDFHIETDVRVETVPLGEYTISEAERDKNFLKLSAYDNLFKMDKSYTLSLVGTPYDIMTTLVSDCGCELAEDEDYYKSLPNGDLTLTINAGSSCNTYRQATSIVAQMCGCFVQADRYGKITLKQFSTTETFSLEMSQRYGSTIADYVCVYVDLVVVGLGGSFGSVSENIESGMTMYIDDAPAWDEGTKETLQTKADNLMAHLENIQYTPSELSIISDPSIDCGDFITLHTDNGTVNTLITSYTWKFHAPTEIQSVGKNPYLTSNNADKQRVLRSLELSGGAGGGSPEVLYTFKNTRKFKCTDRLELLAGVTFIATKDTFAMFDATFQIDVEVNDVTYTSSITVLNSDGTSTVYEVPYTRNGYINVTIQYYYNSAEFGIPYTLTLEKGSHVITLHYPINAIAKDSINRFAVHLSADGGIVSVAKEGFLGTISGQGLASKPKWDGTITIEESIGELYSLVPVNGLGFNADIRVTKPQQERISGITEQFGIIDMVPIDTLEITDNLRVGEITTNYIMSTDNKLEYIYDRNSIQANEGYFSLKNTDIIQGREISVDEGRACSVKIDYTKYKIINNIEVEEL
jgi:hypothetical protein